MYFKQILDERCGCASYLIASRQSHEAAIVDPAIQIEQYEALLRERDFTLRYVIDTHVHADHVSGARALAAAHGAELCLHESAQVAYPFRRLRDGEELPLGQLRLRVWHTPGHRPELISLLVVNPPRSPEPSMVLTGDSLLVGDVGRPDFGGGDAAPAVRQPDPPAAPARLGGRLPRPLRGAVRQGHVRPAEHHDRLRAALQRRWPGSTAARSSPRLTDGVPARPLNMIAIEATNRGAADMAWAMLTAGTGRSTRSTSTALAARPAEARWSSTCASRRSTHHGHVPGAVNLPQAELASRLDELPRDRPIYAICQGGFRSLRAAQFLKQVGYDAGRQRRRAGRRPGQASGQPARLRRHDGAPSRTSPSRSGRTRAAHPGPRPLPSSRNPPISAKQSLAAASVPLRVRGIGA